LDNLKLRVRRDTASHDKIGDFYAKVTQVLPQSSTYVVRFTALPTDVGAFLRQRS